jgi:hypothetical protein
MKTEEWLVIGGLAIVGYLFWKQSSGTAVVPVVVASQNSNLGNTLASLGANVGNATTIATGLSEDISSLINGNTYGS